MHRSASYVTGDTLLVPTVRETLKSLPPLDAVVVHTGGTRVLGVLVTLDDNEGCDLLELLDYRRAVPIHYDDYGAFKTPLDAFVARAHQRGLGERITTVQRGETISLVGAGAVPSGDERTASHRMKAPGDRSMLRWATSLCQQGQQTRTA